LFRHSPLGRSYLRFLLPPAFFECVALVGPSASRLNPRRGTSSPIVPSLSFFFFALVFSLIRSLGDCFPMLFLAVFALLIYLIPVLFCFSCLSSCRCCMDLVSTWPSRGFFFSLWLFLVESVSVGPISSWRRDLLF